MGKFKPLKLPVHPSFILLFLWFLFFDNLYSFVVFSCVVLTHELGHYIVAGKLGYRLDSFFLAPYGVSLNYKEKAFDNDDEIKIALAGPAVNLAVSVILISFWWVAPVSYSLTRPIVIQSLLLGFFNMLPCYPLDGGRVFLNILNIGMCREKAARLSVLLNFFFSAVFFLLFVITCFINFNPTLMLCSAFLIFGALQTKFEGRYKAMYTFKKKVRNFSRPQTLVINSDIKLKDILKRIELNKFTVFYIIDGDKTKIVDENKIKAFAMVFPLETRIKEILFRPLPPAKAGQGGFSSK